MYGVSLLILVIQRKLINCVLDWNLSDFLNFFLVTPFVVGNNFLLVRLKQHTAEQVYVGTIDYHVSYVHSFANHCDDLFKLLESLGLFAAKRHQFEFDHFPVGKRLCVDLDLLSDRRAPFQEAMAFILNHLLIRGKNGLVHDLLVHDHVMVEESNHTTGDENYLNYPSIDR